MTDEIIHLSPLEHQRFGFVTARGRIASLADCELLEEFCHTRDVELAIVRVPTFELRVVQRLESWGCYLTDTLICFRKGLVSAPIPGCQAPDAVRPLRRGEAEAVRRTARDAFRGYLSHYHADPRLPDAACDDLYADWAYRGCSDPSMADEVLVAELDGKIAGFGLVRCRGGEAEGTLYGVAPWARGRGLYSSLVVAAMNWAKAEGCATLIETTQITNLASQKVWSRLRFEVSSSFYTLHRWSESRCGDRIEG